MKTERYISYFQTLVEPTYIQKHQKCSAVQCVQFNLTVIVCIDLQAEQDCWPCSYGPQGTIYSKPAELLDVKATVEEWSPSLKKTPS